MENIMSHQETFSTGKIKKEWETVNGELHGDLKKYLSTGALIKKIIFKHGVLEKVYDYQNDTEYDRNSFINYFEKHSIEGRKKGLRAFPGSEFIEIIDIPVIKTQINFTGKLIFKVWGTHSDLWLVFLSLGDEKLMKIPVYRDRNKTDIIYSGKNSTYDFSLNDNWLSIFEIETSTSKSGRIYIDEAKKI